MSSTDEAGTAEMLRVGMIGLGGIATRSHLPALAARPDVAIKAGAEIDSYQAERTQRRFAIPKVYADYQEMLKREALDAVYVCLPNALHYEAASAALSRGLHVFCEKPVGLSVQEAQGLAEQADRAALVLMPGYYLRFHEHFLRARQLLAERRLGKILQVQATALYSGPYRGWDPKGDWYLNPRSGGVLYDWGSHLVDLLIYITGLDFELVSTAAEKSLPGLPLLDSIAAVVRARGHVIGTVNLGWGARGNLLMLQIHGTAGSLVVSQDYFEHRTPQGGGLNQLGTFLGNSREILANKVGAVIHRQSSDVVHPRATQCFIEAIRGQVQIASYKWDAVRVHQTLGAIAAALERDQLAETEARRADLLQGGA